MAGGGIAGLRPRDVEPAHALVAVAQASSAISRLLACWRMAEHSTLTVRSRPAVTVANPATTAWTTSSRLRPRSMCSSGAKRISA